MLSRIVKILHVTVQLRIALRRLLLTLFGSLRQYSFHFRLLLILISHAFLQKSVYSVSFSACLMLIVS